MKFRYSRMLAALVVISCNGGRLWQQSTAGRRCECRMHTKLLLVMHR